MTPPVIAIVGPSNSGKTRVATGLIRALRARGYAIAAVKHCPHGHQVDRPATDSARLFAAGADKVILASPGQVTSIGRTETDACIEGLLGAIGPGFDLVIAEGFKASSVPKVLVLGPEPLHAQPQNVIAMVGDGVEGENGLPCYSFQELERLARQIESEVLRDLPRDPPIAVWVDGQALPLGTFPSEALRDVISGFLAALKGVPPNARIVRLEVTAAAAEGPPA